MDSFGWDIVSYFFMCALSIAASPQHQEAMRVTIAPGYAFPNATAIVIKRQSGRQNGVYKLKKWSKDGGVSWAIIRCEIVTDPKGQKMTRFICRDAQSRQAFTLSGFVPNLHSANIKSANAALLKLSDGRTTIKMQRSGKIMNFVPSPVLPSDLHLRSQQIHYRSPWSVTS